MGNICDNCGAKLDKNDYICPNCGNLMTKDEGKTNNKRNFLIITVFLVVVLVSGFIVGLLISDGGSSDETRDMRSIVTVQEVNDDQPNTPGDVKDVDGKQEKTHSSNSSGKKNKDSTTGFVNDKYIVECNNVVYGVDKYGLWKNDKGYNKDYLTECSAINIASNGKMIYYGVFNKKENYYPYNDTDAVEIRQYDLYEYNLATKKNRKIIPFVGCGKPVCVVDDILYYTDYPDDFDGDVVGRANGLCSYDMKTGEKKYICDGADIVTSYNDKIFYRDIMVAGTTLYTHQIYCYDINTKKSEKVSDGAVMGFKIISGKLYYDTMISEYINDKSINIVKVYCYDITTGNEKLIFEKDGNNMRIEDYDEKFAICSSGDYENLSFLRVDLNLNKEEKISASIFGEDVPGKAMRDDNRTIFYTDYAPGLVYTMDDSVMKTDVSNSSYEWQTLLRLDGDKGFVITKDSANYYEYYINCGVVD